jgi:hypothetical protein
LHVWIFFSSQNTQKLCASRLPIEEKTTLSTRRRGKQQWRSALCLLPPAHQGQGGWEEEKEKKGSPLSGAIGHAAHMTGDIFSIFPCY